ncbi:ABC transporter permease [Ruminococcus sp.]|uniref:ABC transporter permease n=1 Tax=Ruminococcus sp. TaxID=41978 RepID=UPI001B7A9129|nr:ABC transporter permease [Ruminococcus sp.]MBP5431103.1 FtsX-like permease family protein [Ruminococcus sp.]
MFEFLLARKYITTQKRHSALTICSITIAVTLMSMLFTGFATLLGCLRDAHYDSKPYHMCFMGITSEQADAVKKLPEVESYNINKNDLDDSTYDIAVMFKKQSMKDSLRYLQEVSHEKLGVELKDVPVWIDIHVNSNTQLMNDDLVDDGARFSFVRTLCIFYVFIIIIALTLRLIIDTAFEVSSKEREKQFGVLQSVGATPKQIVRIMTAEGLMLSVIGIPIGIVLGIGCAYIAFRRIVGNGLADAFFTSEKAGDIVRFHISPLMLVIAAITGLVWVLFSAYGTGMRVIKKSPVDAISARSNNVKKVRRHTLMGLLFGWIGKLTSRNARRQKKRFIITIISLTLSLAMFAGIGSVMDSFTRLISAPTALAGHDFEMSLDYNCFDLMGYKKSVEYLENSGYFSKYYFGVTKSAQDLNSERRYYVMYLTNDEYESYTHGKAPVTYEELRDSGSYLFITGADEPDDSIKELELRVNECIASDEVKKDFEERYSAAMAEKKEAKKNAAGNSDSDYEDDEDDGWNAYRDGYIELVKATKDTCKQSNHTFKIAASCKTIVPDNDNPFDLDYNYYLEEENQNKCLIASIDQYETGEYKLYGNFTSPITTLEVDIKSPEVYEKALKYVKQNDDIELWWDMFGELQKIRTTIGAYKIAANFITSLIALIAIVNMVNIVSTGIINRRSELASMQCVGMTQGQLYKMAVIEGVQYTLFATVGAIAICLLGILLTEQFLISIEIISEAGRGKIISYTDPIWRVIAASGFAFIVSVLAAVIPLRRMQKTSLIDQIRSVD